MLRSLYITQLIPSRSQLSFSSSSSMKKQKPESSIFNSITLFLMTFFPFHLLLLTLTTSFLPILVNPLGSASTIAVTYSSATACGIISGHPPHRIECYQNGLTVPIQPNISFQSISGGLNFFCGLTVGGFSILCWETRGRPPFSNFNNPRRIYFNSVVPLTDVTVGDSQVCAREVDSGVVKCWRGGKGNGSNFPSPRLGLKFRTITSGSGFSCGISKNDSRVYCWGDNGVGAEIQKQFGSLTMVNLVAGKSHACGLCRGGFLVCKGSNESGQLDVPFSAAFELSSIALGGDFSCVIKQRNGLVTCWGAVDKFRIDNNVSENVAFELIVAGLDFLCGLSTRNLSMICWGMGWSNVVGKDLPLGMLLPGPCVQSSCTICGLYPNSETLCDGPGNICKPCPIALPVALPLPPIMAPLSPGTQQGLSRRSRNKLSLASVIVGSAGAFAGICTIVYCSSGFFIRKNHNAVQPAGVSTIIPGTDTDETPPPLRAFSVRRYGSQRLGRQRSGSSSSRRTDKIEIFPLSELVAATNAFLLENKIGAGSFGIVYIGKLYDGREVAIKRGETSIKIKKFQDKESAFDSELALLSRLHHKHLVGLIGFCEESDEMILVYEYMSNGSLHDHLHSKSNTEKSSSILNSWRMRIRIALDATRGIEYLHNYAVPPIIHRDIKSSNILLDSKWSAKVSDFGLSLMWPESDQEVMSTKAVGTVGYIDPEYYVLNVLTAKSDVYGLGIVLLELLTGKRAVFNNEEDATGPTGIVDYAVPSISAENLHKVLDKKVGLPEMHEFEAVKLLAYTAIHCVHLEGKDRPNIIDIVANLERALALCEDTPSFSISSD